jgi:hypothetical protein
VFSPRCGGDDSIENSLRHLLLHLLDSKAVGHILVTARFGNINSKFTEIITSDISVQVLIVTLCDIKTSLNPT